VPAAAVVDDAVNLTRKAGKKSASGLVNAVLRGISRRRTALPLPPKPSTSDDRESALDYLSITLSHPRWLVDRWLARVGFERTEAWLHFNNQPAPLTLRALEGEVARNRLREELEASGSDVRNGLYAPLAVVVESGHLPGMSTAHRFVIQDEASQLVALLSGPAPGPLVLDACASPGGKATAIAATLTESELLIACDVRPRRMALLRRTIASAGATNIRLVQLDLTQALPFADSFSTVMVDAPCSGLGTLRRDPDIRWRQTPDALPSFAAKQQLMLDNAAAVIAPGGRLVYATCSSEPEENEQVADGFLARHPEFAPVPASRAHPAIATELEDPRGHFRTEPDRHGLEHFFGAVFQRSHL
jgi:16S rRNA (cytosine967-C5)-methyltransferase